MTAPSRSGVLPVDKGPGVTSFQVVAQLRRLLRAPKVGHGGTLDPDATGVLPILVGEATKLTPYLAELDKEYLAVVRLGVATDTQDMSGAVVRALPVPSLDAAAIARALAPFVGEILQIPPMYSALHHDGRRLYEIAREGREVVRPARRVAVHAIAVEAVALPEFTVRITCGKGTYIRTLAADVGEALGCGAALARLVRTRVGPFTLDAAVPWAAVLDGRDAGALWARLLPPEAALPGLPEARLDGRQARAFLHGQTVPDASSADGPARVHGPDGVFLGVGLSRGGKLKPERLLHADRPRPRDLPV